jgi:nucleoside-diphosphate-sugar epimerase
MRSIARDLHSDNSSLDSPGTVLITGASGKIGFRLVEKLLSDKWKVCALTTNPDKLKKISIGVGSLEIIELRNWVDIHDFSIPNIDAFVHLSGQTSAYFARANISLDLENNVVGLTKILETIFRKQSHIPRVILASSMTQYGNQVDLPIAETAKVSSPTFYELGKNFNERLIQVFSSEGLVTKYNFMRLSNVYGSAGLEKNQPQRGFLDKAIQSAMRGEDLHFFGSGEYLRDYIHIDDVVSAFMHCLREETGYSGPYNIGSGSGVTIKEALELIQRETRTGLNVSINVSGVEFPENAYPIERRNSVADSTLFQANSGWKSIIELEFGLRMAILGPNQG